LRHITLQTTDKTNVHSKFDKRPHRRLITPRSGEWILPILTLILHESASPKRHLDWFSRFCFYPCAQYTQTHRPRYVRHL